MKENVKDAAGEQYKNKVVWNQRGASMEVNNSSGEEQWSVTHYSGSNIKITPSVNSELATNNKQRKVVNDEFNLIGNTKNTFIGGDNIERVVGSSIRQSGYSNPEQVEAMKEWKAQYQPVAERNSMFRTQVGGVSYPNGVTTPENGTRDKNPAKNQELYRNRVNPGGPGKAKMTEIPVVGDGVNQVASLETFELPEAQFQVSNPNEEDYGESESPSTENGIYEPTPEHATLGEDIKRLQDTTLTPLEQKIFGDGAHVGGDTQEFTFRNVAINIGAAINDYPSIRTNPKGRAIPGCVNVGTNAGTFIKVEAVSSVEEVDNSRFPVGTRTTTVGNRDVLEVGSGGVQIKTSGSMEIGATMYKLGANQIHINSAEGVYIDSPTVVSITSRNKISLTSNKQVLINPSLGVQNNIQVGGAAYLQGETYLHHVTAPQEIQTTAEMTLLGRLLEGLEFKCDVSGFKAGNHTVYAEGPGGGTITLKADSNKKVENDAHGHNFFNLPLRLTTHDGDIAKVAEGENINVDGFATPAQAVANGGSGATPQSSRPSSPRELVKQSPNTLLPNNRLLVTATGALKQAPAQLEKFGSFAKEQLAAPLAAVRSAREQLADSRDAVQSLIPGPGQSTVDLQAAGTSEMA